MRAPRLRLRPGRRRRTCAEICRQSSPIARLVAGGNQLGDPDVEIVRRPDHAKGSVALSHCWSVERTIAWLSRLAKDWENLDRKAVIFLRLA